MNWGRNNQKTRWLQLDRSHGLISEAHSCRVTPAGSGSCHGGASRPCVLWGSRGDAALQACGSGSERVGSLCPEEAACLGCCHHGGRRGTQACKLTTSDVLRGSHSYFLWITLPFISSQINLVTVGDSAAATAGPFSAASVLRARGNVFLLRAWAFVVLLVLSSVNATCCGG